jgi:hypothetical protein
LRRADHLSKEVLPRVLIRLLNLSIWRGQGPYTDCRATDDDDDDDDDNDKDEVKNIKTLPNEKYAPEMYRTGKLK